MNNFLKKLYVQIELRSQRERIFLLILTLAIFFVIWNFFIGSSLRLRNHTLSTQITKEKKITHQWQITLEDAQKKHTPQYHQSLIDQKNQLQHNIETLDKKIKKYSANVITSKALPDALKSFLDKRNSDDEFTLTNLEISDYTPAAPVAPVTKTPAPTVIPPSTPAQTPPAKSTAPPTVQPTTQPAIQPTVTMQTITMAFLGNYFSTVHYLQLLENSHWLLNIDRLDYNVTNYPTATITIDLHAITAAQDLTQ